MNEIQIFTNPQFGEIRTFADENNEPLFCAADVCKALGYSNSRKAVSDHVDKGDVTKRDIIDSFGRTQSATFVNESGLYSLIFGSKLDSAKAFKRWVTSEVLPAIRRHGVYATPQTIDSILADPDNAIRLLQNLKEERQQRLIAEQKAQIEAEINKANAPKVLFADAVVGSRSTCLIGELAKILTQNGYTIGQNRLFKWLRENGYLGTKGEYYNIPNQKYQEMGLFEVKTSVHDENGVMVTKRTTKVTGKGQQYFINKFLTTTPAPQEKAPTNP